MNINDTSNKYQSIYHNALANVYIDENASSPDYTFSAFIRDYNHAHNRLALVIMEGDGTWEFHDANYTELPVETANLIAGQKTYQFDNTQAQITGIVVLDQQEKPTTPQLVDERDDYWIRLFESGDTGETPTHMMFYGNGYHFYPTPSVNKSGGIIIYSQKVPKMEDDTVTTTSPGVSQLFHEYYAIATARRYARRFKMDIADDLERDEQRMEQDVISYYEKRAALKPIAIQGSLKHYE